MHSYLCSNTTHWHYILGFTSNLHVSCFLKKVTTVPHPRLKSEKYSVKKLSSFLIRYLEFNLYSWLNIKIKIVDFFFSFFKNGKISSQKYPTLVNLSTFVFENKMRKIIYQTNKVNFRAVLVKFKFWLTNKLCLNWHLRTGVGNLYGPRAVSKKYRPFRPYFQKTRAKMYIFAWIVRLC